MNKMMAIVTLTCLDAVVILQDQELKVPDHVG